MLFRTKITDEGLKGLAGLSSLESLDLSYTDCTGAGLAVLPNRKSLSRLEMIGAKVTDEGLRALTGMTSLDYVGLEGRLLSSSYAPRPGHPEHEPMLKELRALFERYQCNGEIVFPYETRVYFAQIKPRA